MSRSCTPFDHFSKLLIFESAMRIRMGRLRSYPCENTRSHPNSEVKHMWAGLVEWWVTTFESPVLKTILFLFFLFFFPFFFFFCSFFFFFFFFFFPHFLVSIGCQKKPCEKKHTQCACFLTQQKVAKETQCLLIVIYFGGFFIQNKYLCKTVQIKSVRIF